MVFYAIALAPAGNLVRDIRKIICSSNSSAKLNIFHGLPIALYLGFYRGHATPNTQMQFERLLPELFSTLQDPLMFSRLDSSNGDLFVASESSLDYLKEKADEIAGNMELEILKKPPFEPGIGFFIGHDVTCAPIKAFSFRHMDAILVACRIGSLEGTSMEWKILSKVRRLVGPGLPQPHRDKDEFHDIVTARDTPGH
jgi:hypothetical protein